MRHILMTLGMIASLFGCKTDDAAPQSAVKEEIISTRDVSPIMGCYTVVSHTGEAIGVGETDEICLEHSSPGAIFPYAFEFRASGEVIIATGLKDVPSEDACTDCYDFLGESLRLRFDPTGPKSQTVNLTLNGQQHTFSLKPSPTGTEAILGCYLVTGVDGAFGPLVRADQICVLSAANAFRFVFKEDSDQLESLDVSLAESEPSCVYCYEFSGNQAALSYSGDRLDDVLLTLHRKGDAPIEYSVTRIGDEGDEGIQSQGNHPTEDDVQPGRSEP